MIFFSEEISKMIFFSEEKQLLKVLPKTRINEIEEGEQFENKWEC